MRPSGCSSPEENLMIAKYPGSFAGLDRIAALATPSAKAARVVAAIVIPLLALPALATADATTAAAAATDPGPTAAAKTDENAEWNAFLDRLKAPGGRILQGDFPHS